MDSSVMLQCHADGSPPPSVTWNKDGQPLAQSIRLRVLSSGSLQLAFVQSDDTGRYTCTAANPAGTVSLEMSLTVQGRFQYSSVSATSHQSFLYVVREYKCRGAIFFI